MEYMISNEQMRISVETLGAELRSIQSADGTEYLWQRNPDYWDGQAPNIFPYVARLTEQKYLYKGTEYFMAIHGFIKDCELIVEKKGKNFISFRYDSSRESLVQYPFYFTYRLSYVIYGNCLEIRNQVDNLDMQTMYFGIGGHPGFRVPLEENMVFEDYYLEFTEETVPTRIGFTPDCFLNGRDEIFCLEEGCKISLRHSLFDEDAIVLKNICSQITLRSEKGKRGVRMTFPDYPFFGIWQAPHTDAPYICLEPWSSLPSRKNVIENIGQQSDLISLEPRKRYHNKWKIEIF